MGVTVESKEAADALAYIQWLISPPSVTGVLGTEVVEYLQQQVMGNFDQQGTDDGGPWKPLQDATIAIREALGYGPEPINFREGDLFDFATESRGVLEPSATGVELTWPGFADPDIEEKFEVAQQGLDDPFTPARPIVDFSQGDAMAILELLDAWLDISMAAGPTGVAFSSFSEIQA